MVACHFWYFRFSGLYMWTQMVLPEYKMSIVIFLIINQYIAVTLIYMKCSRKEGLFLHATKLIFLNYYISIPLTYEFI